MKITLGSLFDGAGGFPLSGSLAGITPLWASEIEPFPIRVTTKRLPDMKHLGNISAISGAEIDPVDIITFGSPCQDLSVANGNRKGLDGERSGLFREAMRIIREMREATNGGSPTFIVWENVPGAFSSNKGEDFREVLEEIAKTADPAVTIPRPENGKWSNAGEIVGDAYSIAYRVYDAQYWGVPQRRRRIYLVADFRGQRAGRIQFERESLYGNFTESEEQGESTAGETKHCASASSGFNCVIPIDLRQAVKNSEQGDNCGMGIGNDGQPSFTITADQPHGIFTAGFNGHKSVTGNICYAEERSPCLETKMPPNVLESEIHTIASKQMSQTVGINIAQPILATDYKEPQVVIYPNAARSLAARYDSSMCIDRGQNLIAVENHAQNGRAKLNPDVFQTLSRKMGTGGNNTPMALCLDRASYNQGKNAQFDISIQKEQAQTLVAKEPNVVAHGMDCRNATENEELCGTLQAKANGGISYNCTHPVRIGTRVRRLTPLECCRLQGFPDFWTQGLETPEPTEQDIDWWFGVFETHRLATELSKKPKTRNQVRKWLTNPYSDSAEYKMWGNSLAIPCAYTVLAGVAEELRIQKTSSIERKIDIAIARIQHGYKMAAHMGKTLIVAYSGGKDSDVLLDLAIKSNTIFEVQHNHTTADAPETVYHIRKVFQRLTEQGIPNKINNPPYIEDADGRAVRASMWNIIPKKLIPPTRLARYCCEYFKERVFEGQHIMTGVRWGESFARKQRGVHETLHKNKEKRVIYFNEDDDLHKLTEICQLRNRVATNPIIDWTDEEIWEYINQNNIKTNPLYTQGFKRVGCVGCPMAGYAGMRREFEMFPKYRKLYIKAFERMLKNRKQRGLTMDRKWSDAESIYRWWTDPKFDPCQMSLEETNEKE